MAHRLRKPRLLSLFLNCAADRTGVTAIEYALLTGIILIALVALIDGIGASVSGMLSSVTTGF
jgi:Flp pilus assembly pilin Flp